MRKALHLWGKLIPEELETLQSVNKYYKGEIVRFGENGYILVGDEEVEKRYQGLLKATEKIKDF